MVGYSDSDFIGCPDSRKSTSRYVFLLAEGAISWRSVKQSLVATSTTETKFVSYFGATSQAIWLRSFISELQIVESISKPLKITVITPLQCFWPRIIKVKVVVDTST